MKSLSVAASVWLIAVHVVGGYREHDYWKRVDHSNGESDTTAAPMESSSMESSSMESSEMESSEMESSGFQLTEEGFLDFVNEQGQSFNEQAKDDETIAKSCKTLLKKTQGKTQGITEADLAKLDERMLPRLLTGDGLLYMVYEMLVQKLTALWQEHVADDHIALCTGLSEYMVNVHNGEEQLDKKTAVGYLANDLECVAGETRDLFPTADVYTTLMGSMSDTIRNLYWLHRSNALLDMAYNMFKKHASMEDSSQTGSDQTGGDQTGSDQTGGDQTGGEVELMRALLKRLLENKDPVTRNSDNLQTSSRHTDAASSHLDKSNAYSDRSYDASRDAKLYNQLRSLSALRDYLSKRK